MMVHLNALDNSTLANSKSADVVPLDITYTLANEVHSNDNRRGSDSLVIAQRTRVDCLDGGELMTRGIHSTAMRYVAVRDIAPQIVRKSSRRKITQGLLTVYYADIFDDKLEKSPVYRSQSSVKRRNEKFREDVYSVFSLSLYRRSCSLTSQTRPSRFCPI